jgi:hypothetical protein
MLAQINFKTKSVFLSFFSAHGETDFFKYNDLRQMFVEKES